MTLTKHFETIVNVPVLSFNHFSFAHHTSLFIVSSFAREVSTVVILQQVRC